MRTLDFAILQQTVKARPNKIRVLLKDNIEHVSTADKLHVATELYRNVFACEIPSQPTINLHLLYDQLDLVGLTSLSLPFSCEEILRAIKLSSNNSSPGPDGFTNKFCKANA